jgi:hypothetical protein
VSTMLLLLIVGNWDPRCWVHFKSMTSYIMTVSSTY